MSSGSDGEVDPTREVTRLHLMLEDWYVGIRDDISPITDALASDFTWIGPDGRHHDRKECISAWETRRSEYGSSTPPVSVELEEITEERTIYGVHHLTFRKRVRVAGDWEAFTCSLWFRETERVRTGLQWLHLVEVPVTEEQDEDED